MQWDVRIRLRDGISLSGILYLPADLDTAGPAIFTMTPYVAQAQHERGVYFASHGYPFLSVDVRGRGNSQGIFHPRSEARDGYDVVEWIARQPFCNGRVAMCGGSYQGFCQWAVAREQPPHLDCIVPVSAAFFGVDFPMRSNVFLSYIPRWLTLVGGRTSQEKLAGDWSFWLDRFRHWFEAGTPFRELDAHVGVPSALFQEWIAHPHRDDYWDSYNPSADHYAQLNLPVLSITGAYDADQLGALEHYRQHVRLASPRAQSRHYLIIGPWDHAGCANPTTDFAGLKVGTASVIDLRLLQRQWYAWTMQSGPKPEFLRNNVAYYVMGADEWHYADSLQAVTARTQTLYLHSDNNPVDVFRPGSLSPAAPSSSGPDCYNHDPRDVSIAELESRIDPTDVTEQRVLHARNGKQLVYQSAPFVQDVEITGFFRLSLWLSIDRPDTDLRAAVYEMASDGGVVLLSADWIRARYRADVRFAQVIDSAGPLRYDFEQFTFISRRISKGHRLCLTIGPLDSIHWQRNYQSGGCVSNESIADARPVTVMVFHDADRRSALHVPLGKSACAATSHDGAG
jgi:uncharacterized protein